MLEESFELKLIGPSENKFSQQTLIENVWTRVTVSGVKMKSCTTTEILIFFISNKRIDKQHDYAILSRITRENSGEQWNLKRITMYTAQNAQITTAIPDDKKVSFFDLLYCMRDLVPWNVTPRYRREVRPLLTEPPLFSNFSLFRSCSTSRLQQHRSTH